MPEYIRYVSVYTGPGLFQKLKDEYIEAWERMTQGKNTKVIRDEDIRTEDSILQLHSHLLFSVSVDSQDAPRSEIIDSATNMIASCLHPETRDSGDSFESVNHPLFDEDGRVIDGLLPSEWCPTDVDRQFLAYPRICAEDAESKRVRRERLKAFGTAQVTYRRDSLGNTTSQVVDGAVFKNSDPNTPCRDNQQFVDGVFTINL
ncbi:uncharacterized protein LDX57_009747 [Aspergillus melleus]|uniref:uncharacterized protein n=1 Tax=Aspergillus melleus TaxID=138277 RepID=UPI001E8DEEF7|nr:uncharacterized protein LDX57_009747 [Aspergillus melleus]KAH8432101.1 hypothetical protein LDX57_009747 [Aspergillus melleus]